MVNTRSTSKDANDTGDTSGAQAASAPPVASRAPWNGIRAPLVPPTPSSAISGTLSVPGSSLAPPAPPPSERRWGGILTPNAFRQEGSSAAPDQQALNPGSSHSRISEFERRLRVPGQFVRAPPLPLRSPFQGSLPPPRSPHSQGHAQPDHRSHSPRRRESRPTPRMQGSAAPAAEDAGAGSEIPIAERLWSEGHLG
ncbi:hypothetical protein BT96DRAFT_1002879 [Gymnopus androsaceus JB14]|uniref:Uncharacterized protein n=1 Tax=Gymnopus androsaceus JB14 TaxID=1447944 RepID=A0A6A4GXL7_9AGAR|nr:hypothetical protein BT96DRAFT_1002879 [Gymnopus androsaceus JB14]